MAVWHRGLSVSLPATQQILRPAAALGRRHFPEALQFALAPVSWSPVRQMGICRVGSQSAEIHRAHQYCSLARHQRNTSGAKPNPSMNHSTKILAPLLVLISGLFEEELALPDASIMTSAARD